MAKGPGLQSVMVSPGTDGSSSPPPYAHLPWHPNATMGHTKQKGLSRSAFFQFSINNGRRTDIRLTPPGQIVQFAPALDPRPL